MKRVFFLTIMLALSTGPVTRGEDAATEERLNQLSGKATKPEKGFEYVVQSGDTLLAIVKAYREKNVKVTQDEILKANPGLVATRLKVGQKIWIPAPQS